MTAQTHRHQALEAAIDFGISNTDVVARIGGELRHWNQPYDGDPDEGSVRAILAAGGIDLAELDRLAVTGGRHKLLPTEFWPDPDHSR